MYSLLFSLANAYTGPSLSSADHQKCPADSAASCSLTSGSDTCCYEATNGIFLSTQFWDYNPATGPSDAFTLHGLWSDKCTGGYNQFCNPSWEISKPRSILQGLGKTDLLSQMDTFWKNYNGDDEDLWEHEFNKHGTCMYTLGPDCYTGGDANERIGDFYQSVFNIYQSLPTYNWLTSAGIHPDESKTYRVSEIHSVLSQQFNGQQVFLGCDKKNNLQEVWYFYSLEGAVPSGKFTPIDSISKSTCKDGMKWVPKGRSGSVVSTDTKRGCIATTSGTAASQPTTTQSGSKGTLKIVGQSGCLISRGKWFTSGTCATFSVAETIGGISLSSSKGPCGIVNGSLQCGSDVTSGDFTLDGDNYLEYGGNNVWSSGSVASGQDQESVSPGSGSVEFKIQLVSA